MLEFRPTTLGKVLQATGGQIQTGPFGTVLKASEYAPIGVPVISVGEVGYGRLSVRRDTPRVDSNVTSRLPEYVLRAGDIVFARKGAVDRVGWVTAEEEGWFLGSDGISVRIGRGVDSRFVAYQLQTRRSRGWLLQHAAGSTMASLNQRVLRALPLSLPGHAHQRAIAEVLGALDDKIAVNNEVIRGADRLTRALFAALPKDDVAPLSSVAQFVNGKAFTKNASGTGRVVVRIAELNSGIGGSTVYNDIDVPDQHVVREGDILFAWSGSLTLHRWYRDEAIVNQHIFKVIPNEGRPHWLVWGLIASKLEEFRAIAADKATTMGHIQRRHLDESVRIPTPEVIAQNNTEMAALWERALAAERENPALVAAREALLPGLMSGKLRVKDAERLAVSLA